MGLSDAMKPHRLASGRRLSWVVLTACVLLLAVAFGLGALLGSGDALRKVVTGSVAIVLTSIALWIVSLLVVVVASARRAKRDAQDSNGL